MRASVVLVAAAFFVQTGFAEPTKKSNIPYAEVDGRPLLLDIYLPTAPSSPPPLVVYVHGGAWRSGSKDPMPLEALVRDGFAVASVEYRLSSEARFPAQAHDIKAAIRFLRARHGKYGYAPERIAITGSSAGGHLAALVGVTNRHRELEGGVGAHLDESSDVQAIVSYYGAADLTSILGQSTPHGLSVRVPALELLLGGQPQDLPRLAKLASPLFHVDSNDPPLLLLHGDKDIQMPIEQSYQLRDAYAQAGLPVRMEAVDGAGHGGGEFYDAVRTALAIDFLRASMRGRLSSKRVSSASSRSR